MNDLQIAQELEERDNKLNDALYYSICTRAEFDRDKEIIDKQAKANLEGLGCGKEFKPYTFKCGTHHTYSTYNYFIFCPDCLAKGVDKAKAIYEEILK